MSLPPGFLDELRTRTTLSRVVGRKVVWDLRKSNQAKGDFWAPCPFHQEKTASYHCDDRKGFYYCFGCHAKGDAVTFLKEAEGMAFIEAVETLAREAGMTMPARDPEAAKKADRFAELAEVMEAAVRFYRLQLRSAAAAEARDYLARRGLGEAAIDRWEIGFAPSGWEALRTALAARGIAPEAMLDCGLVKASDKGRTPYDVFRNRIMFPIRDARGRAIAFGGRAMDPNDQAKYLNSPETLLFDKGRNLFNAGPARDAVAKGAPLIVAEGYMDVIALSGAGFTGAVAPLGTAITEDQLRLLWRIHPEPVVALDGDAAGMRAAIRLVDLALPLVGPGQSLRFVLLPEGLDPDDLIRARGPQAMQALLEATEPMVALLWRRETEGRPLDSPERRAALDAALKAALRRIADASVRSHYEAEIRRLRADLFTPARTDTGHASGTRNRGIRGDRRPGMALPDARPTPALKSSLLARAPGAEVEDHLREAVILAICYTHPALVARFEPDLDRIDLTGPGHDVLRRAILRHQGLDAATFRDAVRSEAGEALEKLLALSHVRIAPPARSDADPELAARCLAEEIVRHAARQGTRAEIDEAIEDLRGLADEGVTWRLAHAAEQRHRAERANLDDEAALGEDRAALSAGLQRLIESEVWVKKKR
jgi:DNA primase